VSTDTRVWLAQGVCARLASGYVEATFFAERGQREELATAKAICSSCPVVSQCLAWALETGQDAGVWGGLTADERRALRLGAGRKAAA
jgi:hypothetical protein